MFDFVPLRETLLLEVRNGEWICPVSSFLLSKIENEVFFTLSNYLEGKQRTRFQTATGEPYEEYAHKIIGRLGSSDKSGKWIVKRKLMTRRGEELADSSMQQRDVAVVFEYKAKRLDTDFLRGRNGDRVIGPSAYCLRTLDSHASVSLSKGRRQDQGFLTQGMGQQSKSGARIIAWAGERRGSCPCPSNLFSAAEGKVLENFVVISKKSPSYALRNDL